MRRITAATLIELAIGTLRDEIRPTLNADQRYNLAMTLRALQTARHDILTEPEAAQWEVLDYIYDDGAGRLDQLARDIRSGKVSSATHGDLRQQLEKLLVAELDVRNPAALKRRHMAST